MWFATALGDSHKVYVRIALVNYWKFNLVAKALPLSALLRTSTSWIIYFILFIDLFRKFRAILKFDTTASLGASHTLKLRDSVSSPKALQLHMSVVFAALLLYKAMGKLHSSLDSCVVYSTPFSALWETFNYFFFSCLLLLLPSFYLLLSQNDQRFLCDLFAQVYPMSHQTLDEKFLHLWLTKKLPWAEKGIGIERERCM